MIKTLNGLPIFFFNFASFVLFSRFSLQTSLVFPRLILARYKSEKYMFLHIADLFCQYDDFNYISQQDERGDYSF